MKGCLTLCLAQSLLGLFPVSQLLNQVLRVRFHDGALVALVFLVAIDEILGRGTGAVEGQDLVAYTKIDI